jgi:cyanophycinase-like exopeptidase
VGLPRYLTLAGGIDDLERTLALADDLIALPERSGAIALVQCGGESPMAVELARLLGSNRRRAVPILVKSRTQAQSSTVLGKLDGISAAWVFADDLFETFMNVFATQLAFALRARARQGMPVVGLGSGALALGGLLIANRVCTASQFELVSGLGWAPRVLVDGGANRGSDDGAITRTTVRSLPGLLGIDLGLRGGLRVEGGRVESIGGERVVLHGADELGRLHMLSLDPGQVTTIAPPPFAPFDRGLLPSTTAGALAPDERADRPTLRQAPEPDEPPAPPTPHPGPVGRLCPMCGKVHSVDKRVELAA